MKGGKIRKEMMYVRNRERKSKRGKGGGGGVGSGRVSK